MPGLSGRIERVDWDGNQAWSYTRLGLHHDIEPLPNGNILMLGAEELSTEEQIALGRDPARATKGLKLDYLVELKPEGREGGTIVWEWRMKNHLVQDFDRAKKNYGIVSDHVGEVDINFIENPKAETSSNLRVLQSLGYVSSGAKFTPQSGSADWTHANSVAYHKGLDQIMLSLRSLSEIWIIDHSTTTAEAAGASGGKRNMGGRILYRWGNPQAYQSGSPADQMLFGQHDAQWIGEGTAGEGNILIFNNGEGRKDGQYSSIEEIRPPLKSDGSYERIEREAFGPTETAWRYVSEKREDFSSDVLSGVQRLLNGNTLICSGTQGRVFEVTRDGDTVWEQKIDITMRPRGGARRPGGAGGAGPRRRPGMRPGVAGAAAGGGANDALAGGGALFRATRYGLDHPAFGGRLLESINSGTVGK